MANDNQNFDDTLIGRENRESNYRTWSERAVIVGFNAESQTYDIVITTEKTLGNNIRTLNRVIRQVKAIIDPNTDIFLPGESIIVGYVDDRREHPIIVGLGDSSDHNCVKVTLGIISTVPTIEGTTAPSLADPVFTPTPCRSGDFLEDSLTGSTITLTLNCSSLDITGCFEAEVEAPSGCGCGVYDWSLSGGGAGFTISDEGALAQAVGITTTIAPLNDAGSKIKICPPVNSGGPAGVLAYYIIARGQDPNDCDNVGTVCFGRQFDCNDDGFGTFGDTFFCKCNTNSCPPVISGSNNCANITPICQGTGTFDCGLPTCVPGPGDFSPMIDALRIGDYKNCITPTQLSAGCAPCVLSMGNSILTAEDACGKMLSIEVQVEP